MKKNHHLCESEIGSIKICWKEVQLAQQSHRPVRRIQNILSPAMDIESLCAREGRRPNQIMYLLYDALWKEEQAWGKISRIVKEHISDPLVAPGQDHDCDLDLRGSLILHLF